MAFFSGNTCQYSNCGRQFPTLNDLIIHIEDTHIDFDPETLEESERSKPLCVPMSYVLRYKREETVPEAEGASGGSAEAELAENRAELIEKIQDIKLEPDDEAASSSGTPVLDDSFKGWCGDSSGELSESKCKSKKFSCPVAGCNKRYKNQNGMKYHIINYHDMTGNPIKPKKEFKCQCGREYKTLRGLQSHTTSHKEGHHQVAAAPVGADGHRQVLAGAAQQEAADRPTVVAPQTAESEAAAAARPSEIQGANRGDAGFVSFSTVYSEFHFKGFDA